MARYKTFNATGIAPDGRLYAGDLNAIQDFLAKQADFTQTIDTGSLRIGEAGLQLTRYGVGEARITGILRTDGLMRAGGGILAGTFTTAQRDAIAVGQRPPGLTIYNSTINRYETNFGSDASPTWGLTGEPIAGVMWPWPYSEASVPNGWALCYGQVLPKTLYPNLWALANAAGFPHGGDASNVILPDMRGRITVGKDNMGGLAANRVGTGNAGQTLGGVNGNEKHPLVTAEMPTHNHTGATTGGTAGDTAPQGYTFGADGAHTHRPPAPWNNFLEGDLSTANLGSGGSSRQLTVGQHANTDVGGSHQHSVQVNGHGHSVPALGIYNDGGGGAPAGQSQPHNNLQPGMILNWIIKLG